MFGINVEVILSKLRSSARNLHKTSRDISDVLFTEVGSWEAEVKKALSVPLPSIYKRRHSLIRPDEPFPHLDEGYLRNSFKVNTVASGSIKDALFGGVFKETITISMPQHGYFTNEGLRRRQDGSSGEWEGWFDDITEHGRDTVAGLSDLLESLEDELSDTFSSVVELNFEKGL